MRLCLDEHYSARIAHELRRRGHDVSAVKERPDLLGASDRDLWDRMQEERRALLTENVADFLPLVRDAMLGGEHYGVVFSSPRSLPRAAATIGTFVELLDDLMRGNPGDDDFRSRVHWLAPAAE